jgi:hypothetical protein
MCRFLGFRKYNNIRTKCLYEMNDLIKIDGEIDPHHANATNNVKSTLCRGQYHCWHLSYW